MMKNFILIVIVIVGILMAGIFTVDERQNAIVTNRINQQAKVYTTGLHFTWPLLTRINYVYINQRTAAFNFKLALEDGSVVSLTSIVLWQVTNPRVFLQQSINMTSTGFSQALNEKVKQLVVDRAQHLNLSELNQYSILIDQKVLLDNLGITLYRISVNEINTISIASLPLQESEIMVKQIESIPSDVTTIAIESAYYQAQTIKTQVEIEQARMYREIQVKDPGFYDYFRKLQIYKNSATSKQEMPPLEELYGN